MGKKRRHKPSIPSSQNRQSRVKRKKTETRILLDKFSDVDLRSWNKLDNNLSEYQIRFFYHLEAQRVARRQELLDAVLTPAPISQDIHSWVRVVPYKYTLDPLSTLGSISDIGGRFNLGKALGSASFTCFNALYIANNIKTAYNERFGNHSSKKLSGFDLALQSENSFSTFMLEGCVENLFDLTNANNLKRFMKVTKTFGISREIREIAKELGIATPQMIHLASELKNHLMQTNWRHLPMQFDMPSNSQVFGRLLFEAGYDGVIYNSSFNTGKCIAIFPKNIENSDTSVSIVGDAPSKEVNTVFDANTWRKFV